MAHRIELVQDNWNRFLTSHRVRIRKMDGFERGFLLGFASSFIGAVLAVLLAVWFQSRQLVRRPQHQSQPAVTLPATHAQWDGQNFICAENSLMWIDEHAVREIPGAPAVYCLPAESGRQPRTNDIRSGAGML